MPTTELDLFFHPSTERQRFPYQGAMKSLKLDSWNEQSASDLVRMAELHNALVSYTADRDAANWRDNLFLAKRIEALEREIQQMRYMRATNGVRVTNWHSFRNAGPVSYLTGTPLSRRAIVDTIFGEATLPLNAIQSKFYSTSPRTGRIIPEENLSISVTGSFDKLDGDGLVDREYSSEQTRLDAGDPELAFNGSNLDRWIRRVEFDLDSDVDHIETQITVRVPLSLNLEANLLSVRPHPNGSVDVLGAFLASDLSESFTALSGFQKAENAEGIRWHFPAQQVRQVRLWLRQRDWVEENGKKVFYIGAEEIGLFLADWDKTYVSDGELTDNHSVLVRMDAPAGFRFATMHHFRSSPDYYLEDAGSRHVHYVIATDDQMVNIVWNSDQDQRPQDLSAGINLGGLSGSLYVLLSMNWIGSSGGVNSPFQVNTPPYQGGFGFETTLVPE